MRPPTVMFDIDAVIGNFNAPATKLAERLFPQIRGHLPRSPHEAKTWIWQHSVPTWTDEMDRELWKAIRADAMFWFDLPCLLTHDEVFRIRALGDVYYVTNRSGDGVKDVTTAWLRHHGLGHMSHRLICSREPKDEIAAEIHAEYAIEDNGDNALLLLRAGVHTAVLRYPYNDGHHPAIRDNGGAVVHSVSEFLDLIPETR